MASERGRINGITEGVIWKQLLIFFFPIMLGTFFQQLYNTVDAVIVGQYVGKEALAAVGGSTGTLINLLVGFFVGLSSGATVIISQYYGAYRPAETSLAVHTATALGIAGGVVFMVVGLIVSPLALTIMSTPADIFDHALSYIRIYFLGMVFNLVYNMGAGILRAVGDSKRPLYFLIFSTLLNVVLDLLFVVALNLGVNGAAIATILCQAVSAVLVMYILMRSDDVYRVRLRDIRFSLPILRDIVRIGLPAGLQSVIYNVSNIIVQATINSFDTNVIAAWTANGKIDGIFWMIMGAFGTATTTFSGQNFGAQKYDRIRRCVRVCGLMAFGAAALISTVVLVFGPLIFRIFTSDEGVIESGMQIIHALAPFYFTYVCVEVISGTVRGAGDSFWPMIITCFGVCVGRILWILFVVPQYHTIEMLVWGYPISWALTSVLFIIYYLQGGWLRRSIRKAGFAPEPPRQKKGVRE
ncbi:MATE family efflux transporter [Anaeromassilibacillus sp. An200]|uniref:MATE family efflux transporter n=1 Tax=Anaeromassilibacillus sp. An200 TaxID=1965587 RepID=UPI000B39259C|nr:MATE family efflux transporter [Anaeromassilibacillus sp. An200]OUP14094.1 MATE family efflux transporter [Anaeromassilibacillus sp. An200]